ncbi:antitoxin Xre/MbcA/ParS toxin-binding domain-containing protein [Sphingomonas crusticola]|uniref:antitoxin Xre/MbcA/ParS toxin-binding domain-containing protein n=1 Tax=Sphingomonas crusticola TaxID=1697973 RepID=UPI000E239921|nr:antitoxin Xre/MbcA/ParS toxin-binding domain-containing protein [Sphingomonas crusticola]
MNKPFRNRFDGPRLAPEQAARQGRASRLAFDALREPAAVMAFLNSHDDALGGRPLDLAIASPEGLASVERALAARSAG